MDTLPNDPFMLMSMVNMKLRDGDYDSLEALCDDYGIGVDELCARLAQAGFEYIPEAKKFG